LTAGPWLVRGGATMAAGVGLAVFRATGGPELVSPLAMVAFLGGAAMVAFHFLKPTAPEAPPPSTGYVGAAGHHKAILDAAIAAHPAGSAHVRLVLKPVDGAFETEMSTLPGRAVPPSVRRPIEALAAHLHDQDEPLVRVILEARIKNDGTWNHVIDVGREPTRR
jgi:hypothetical protein